MLDEEQRQRLEIDEAEWLSGLGLARRVSYLLGVIAACPLPPETSLSAAGCVVELRERIEQLHEKLRAKGPQG